MRARLALAGIVALFIALRFALFFDPALHLGWNSDAAIFGLMAKAIAAGTARPLFFWRQSYMGTGTSYVTAALFNMMSAPLALRVASSLEVLAGIIFYWLGLRRAFDVRVANIVALWLAIGPAYLMHFSIAPIGGEQMFVLSAIIFWFAERTRLARNRDWLILGLLAGFGWWMHQGIVFALGAAILAQIAHYRSRLAEIRLSKPLLVIAAFLGVDLILGEFVSLGFVNVPALFLYRPVIEPLAALLLLVVLANLRLLRVERDAVQRAAFFAVGAVIGYAPVIVGKIEGVVPDSYGLSVPLMPFSGVVGHAINLLRGDLWSLVGAAASILVIPFFILAMTRRPRMAMPLITIILCAIFYLFSSRAHPGSVRYVVAALPMVYAFAAAEMLRMRGGAIAIIAVTLALLVPRIEQIRDVAQGRAEYYGGLPGGFDLRPTLHAIEAQGYTICYADYWLAYKLQWMSDERVRVIPFHSFDRSQAASRALAAAPGPKCYVDAAGRVRRFDPRDFDETTSRTARERLRRMTAAPIIP
jgi:hypothetical protein